MLSAEKIARVRNFSFGATGLIGLLYAVLVVFTKRPDPMPWWLPGTVGLLSATLIFSTFRRAGPVPVQQATDELFKRCGDKAHRFGFWSALLLYPFFRFFNCHRCALSYLGLSNHGHFDSSRLFTVIRDL